LLTASGWFVATSAVKRPKRKLFIALKLSIAVAKDRI
jgi:ABC-type transport system involved in cytochrome bd biosynthesis fused ATPase/permease subunit